MIRVAIIGAGPAGLASAKALALEPFDFAIDLYERRDGVGGIWNYNKNSSDKFISPMYNYLETNLQPNLMEYANLSFTNPDHRTYPTRQNVQSYLEKYFESIIDGKTRNKVNLFFNHNVLDITKTGSIWNFKAEDFSSDSTIEKEYDAIIVANGHFSKGYIPKVMGLKDWPHHFIIHSKDFVDSSPYHDLNVLVVGNSSSGIDIATQVITTAKNVYISGHNHKITTPFKDLQYIEKYDYNNEKSILTEDGILIKNIDRIIFCTGYEYEYPFFENYHNKEMFEPFQIKDLYKQVFSIQDTSLVFPCINKGVVPMPLSEIQAAVIARVFSGRIQLPDKETMFADYKKELSEKGSKIHDFGYPLDVKYFQKFTVILDENPESQKSGLLPRVWDEDMIHQRSQTAIIKQKRIEQVLNYALTLKNDGKEFKLLDENLNEDV